MSQRSISAIDKLEVISSAITNAGDDATRELHLEYLALIGELLIEQHRGHAVLSPLLDIHEALEALYRSQNGRRLETERRQSMQLASPSVMARVTAVIDILVSSGLSSDHAAQVVSRQMMARKLMLPESGGDARGWKRVQIWRQKLISSGRSHPQAEEAARFKEELLAQHGSETANLAVKQALWDRRGGR